MKKKKPKQPAGASSTQSPISEVEELVRLLQSTNVSEVSIERNNIRITIKTHQPYAAGAVVVAPAAAPMPAAPLPAAAPPPEAKAPAAPSTPEPDESKLITIRSPMIGTFYRSPAPDKPPFVNVGDEIKPGTILCMIEAMKLFNEIESEHHGRIVKVLVENGKPVEYDQPLFLVEPL
ncbi:MAG: acetyl-CoA carboxylase biotin carboxyl carrier protein [Chitinophagales bacterium]|nr:acetyl-CoA carboxylase biotin carboxyl carrier protein [Chitinophagales bacterium]MDW8392934.1 acetyl-CoA carboxylase biotin carboxyl carrier protein [Chitinophagales bacterium]